MQIENCYNLEPKDIPTVLERETRLEGFKNLSGLESIPKSNPSEKSSQLDNVDPSSEEYVLKEQQGSTLTFPKNNPNENENLKFNVSKTEICNKSSQLDNVDPSSEKCVLEQQQSSPLTFPKNNPNENENLKLNVSKTEICEKELDKNDSGSINEEEEQILNALQRGIKGSLENSKSFEGDLLMMDFQPIEEFNFNGDSNGDGPNYTLLVYAPVAFGYFREQFAITTADFLTSICSEKLRDSGICGCSGSKFYFTRDDRFILKTVTKKEANFLLNLFPGYFLNLSQNTKTLLPKFYGLYCYRTITKRVRFLVMNNILPNCYTFREKYDLKGSTYAPRKYEVEEYCYPATLKDLDFIERCPGGLELLEPTYNTLLESINRDCQVLESHNIMDYSLLLGVALTPNDSNSQGRAPDLENSFDFSGPLTARTGDGEIVYLCLGVIDILQSYNWTRKVESFCKSIYYSKNTISIIPPGCYSARFQQFLKSRVFKCIPKLKPFNNVD